MSQQVDNQSNHIADLFGSVLDYALPGAVWEYKSRQYGSAQAARLFLPLFIGRVKLWQEKLGYEDAWGIDEHISFSQDSDSPCGLKAVISPEMWAAPLLLYLMDVALSLNEDKPGGIISLDILDERRNDNNRK